MNPRTMSSVITREINLMHIEESCNEKETVGEERKRKRLPDRF